MSAHVPLRTCVGCGTRAPQSALMRFTATAEGLRADVGRRAAGRGAYLHGVPTCLAALITSVPAGTLTDLPSMVRLIWSGI